MSGAGRGDLNKQVKDYPTREQWALLGREVPTLLIVDELEDWFAAQDTREQVRTKDALANLLEAAELPDVPLSVVLAVYGTNDDLMAVVNRLQPPVWDVGTAEDRQKIVRHRLIEKLDKMKAKRVVRDYIEVYEKVRGELPSLSHLADLRKEMEESYPFHPHFLRQAYQVYAAMPRHESTRGVVGVCATLLRQWASQRDVILTGDLDITNEAIASDLRKLDPELVQNATEDLRQRCTDIPDAAGIIGTVLLHSFSPHGTPGATEEDALTGSLRVGGNINDLRAALEEVRNRAWFVDEIDERLVVTKEVVLVKQIEQMARMRSETPEGREQAAEHLRKLIREAMGTGHLTLYPDEPLPSGSSSAVLKCIVSLVPLREQEALAILKGVDNTTVLLVPKGNVREKITADRDLLLRALRVLVCEDLLRQRGKRQNEVRHLKNRFESELRQQLHGSYARWMRLSRIYLQTLAHRETVSRDQLVKMSTYAGVEFGELEARQLMRRSKKAGVYEVLTPVQRKTHLEKRREDGELLAPIDRAHWLYIAYREGRSLREAIPQVYEQGLEEVLGALAKITRDRAYERIGQEVERLRGQGALR